MAIQLVTYYNGDKILHAVFQTTPDKIRLKFPEYRAKKGTFGFVGFEDIKDWNTDKWLPVTRRIEYKKNPSLHKCDARCQNAKGHICECSCGGKNHGINA